MSLLELARGPLWTGSVAVFALGVAWRLFALWRIGRKPDLSAPRTAGTAGAAVRTVFTRMLPRAGFRPSATLITVNPYVYHLGLALIAFGYLPHIEFLHRVAGVSWPGLPNAVMYVAAGATIVSLCIALLFRLTDPVLKLISSAGDYATWVVTMLPLLTGMALIAEPAGGGGDPVRLALHLLSLELLLAWFPFGKLMHAILFVPGRAQIGAFLGRRGVRA
jgi:nitrate reductase gamma subunit